MAATNHTSNIELNQWVRTDPFSMDDFNEDNQKIDEAITAADAKIDSTKATLQSALNKKQNTILGAVSSYVALNMPTKRVVCSDTGGKLAVSQVTTQELEFLKGITGSVQEQLNARLRIKTGSYTGTGTKGADDPNSLTFDFYPLIVIISDSGGSRFFRAFRGLGNALCQSFTTSLTDTSNPLENHTAYSTWRCAVTWGNNNLSWYTGISGNHPSYQFNDSDISYSYIAIGY